MIEIKNATKRFEEVVAVNNLSLNIEPGIIGIVGHNGAGKSTLLRLIADVYNLDSGEIIINGEEHTKNTVKKDLFFLSDDPYIEGSDNAEQVFSMYEMFYEIDHDKFAKLMKKFDLPMDRKVNDFSKGMKRQLLIGLALCSKCSIILLDEAFDGLDPLVLERIKTEIIKSASEGNKTIVIATHNVLLLERLAEKFAIINRGKVGKTAGIEDIGCSFTKFQCLFNKPINREMLMGCGINVVSFKKTGSLVNFVSYGDFDLEKVKKILEPTLIESVPIDSSEIMALEMVLANREEVEEDEEVYR